MQTTGLTCVYITWHSFPAVISFLDCSLNARERCIYDTYFTINSLHVELYEAAVAVRAFSFCQLYVLCVRPCFFPLTLLLFCFFYACSQCAYFVLTCFVSPNCITSEREGEHFQRAHSTGKKIKTTSVVSHSSLSLVLTPQLYIHNSDNKNTFLSGTYINITHYGSKVSKY